MLLKKYVVDIIYGYRTNDAFEKAEQGNIELGGCMIYENSPDYHCNECSYQWQKGKRNEGHYEEDEDGPI